MRFDSLHINDHIIHAPGSCALRKNGSVVIELEHRLTQSFQEEISEQTITYIKVSKGNEDYKLNEFNCTYSLRNHFGLWVLDKWTG